MIRPEHSKSFKNLPPEIDIGLSPTQLALTEGHV